MCRSRAQMAEDIKAEELEPVTARLDHAPRTLTFAPGTSATHIQVPDDADVHVSGAESLK